VRSLFASPQSALQFPFAVVLRSISVQQSSLYSSRSQFLHRLVFFEKLVE
jgi:hypothetical protein